MSAHVGTVRAVEPDGTIRVALGPPDPKIVEHAANYICDRYGNAASGWKFWGDHTPWAGHVMHHAMDRGELTMDTQPGLPNHNPYAEPVAVAHFGEPGAPLELRQRAQGLHLSDFDDMARQRWLDGYRSGRNDGGDDLRRATAEAYAEGHVTGYRHGSAEGRGAVGEQFAGRIHMLHNLAEQTIATPIPVGVAFGALEAIAGVLERIIDEFDDRTLVPYLPPDVAPQSGETDDKATYVQGLVRRAQSYVPEPEGATSREQEEPEPGHVQATEFRAATICSTDA